MAKAWDLEVDGELTKQLELLGSYDQEDHLLPDVKHLLSDQEDHLLNGLLVDEALVEGFTGPSGLAPRVT
jgi:hypothetical protein